MTPRKICLLTLGFFPFAASSIDPPGGKVTPDRIKAACVVSATQAHREQSDLTSGDIDAACSCMGEFFPRVLAPYPVQLRIMLNTHEGQEYLVPAAPYVQTRGLRYDEPARMAVVDAMNGFTNCTQHIAIREYTMKNYRRSIYHGSWTSEREPVVPVKKGPSRFPPPQSTMPEPKPGEARKTQVPMQ